MPRNGSGTYVLPPGNPVVTQTVIRSQWANSTMGDLAAALSQSIAKDGQTAPTGNLPMAGYKHTNVGLAQQATQYARADQVQSAEFLIVRNPAAAVQDTYTGELLFGSQVFTTGQFILFYVPATNVSQATLNINAGGARTIKRNNGDLLQPGDLIFGSVIGLVWDVDGWRIMGGGAGSGSGGTSGVTTWNARSGTVVMNTADVQNALGFVPANVAGQTFTGAVFIPSTAPTLDTQVVNKGYVDGRTGGTLPITSLATNTPQTLNISLSNPQVPNIVTITNVANGLVKLDSVAKIPPQFVDFTGLTFLGVWDASGGTLPAAATQGSYYVINEPGTLSLYVFSGGSYVLTPTICDSNDQIVYIATATAGRPVGWYFIPKSTGAVVAATVSCSPTPTFPGAGNVQAWINQADPALAGKLNLAGGSMTGQLLLGGAPSAPNGAANKQYVDDKFATAPQGVVSFNTRTGAVTLVSNDVTLALGFAPLPTTGGTLTGSLILPAATPTNANQAVTKAYVDSVGGGGGGGGGLSSVLSSDPAMISVENTPTTATMTLHSNVANGMVKLDGSGLVPIDQLPVQGLSYQGEWDAVTNTIPPPGTAAGQFYIVVGTGTLLLYATDGDGTFSQQNIVVQEGDILIWNAVVTVEQPLGWYYLKRTELPGLASTTASTPTPLAPGALNVQEWMDTIDPSISGRLLRTGGTMTGPITLAGDAAAALQPTTLQQMQAAIAAVPAGVTSFNGRTAAVTLQGSDVTTALGYTAANVAGQAFSGAISAPQFNGGNFVGGKFDQYLNEITPATGSIALDFSTFASQVIRMTGAVNFTSLAGISEGNMARLTLENTDAGAITWPAVVVWPGPSFAPPDFAAGPAKCAIVALEVLVAVGAPFGYYALANVSVY